MKSASRWNLQLDEICKWMKLGKKLILKKEVDENEKFTHLQKIFPHLQKKWNKFTYICRMSTNLPTTSRFHPPTGRGCFWRRRDLSDDAPLSGTASAGHWSSRLRLPCEQIHAPPDQTWRKLAASSDRRRQRKRKCVTKDLGQWMFLMLRTGVSVGFVAGDCKISIGFATGYRKQQVGPWELQRDDSGTT